MVLESEITEEEAQQELDALMNQYKYHTDEVVRLVRRMIVLLHVLGKDEEANLFQQMINATYNVQNNPDDIVDNLHNLGDLCEDYLNNE